MKRGVLFSLGFAVAAIFAAATSDAEPVAGVDVGPAVPISAYRHSVDTGGAIGVWGGYGVRMNDWLWAGVVVEPQFTLFSADQQLTKKTSTLFSFTGGPRVTLGEGNFEAYVAALGGVYTDVGGLFHDTGGGINAGGGFDYYLVPNLTSLGVFVRYNWSGQSAAIGSSADREFLVTGFTVAHRFLQGPAPVPPPPTQPSVFAPPPGM